MWRELWGERREGLQTGSVTSEWELRWEEVPWGGKGGLEGRWEFEAQSCAIPRQTLVWGRVAVVQAKKAGEKSLGLVVAGWEPGRNGELETDSVGELEKDSVGEEGRALGEEEVGEAL